MKIKANLIWIIFVSLTTTRCAQPTPETFIIPENFKGRVNIIFNKQNGDPGKIENGRRIYRIPKSGVLLTQFNDESGIIDQKYFYCSGKGKLVPLKIFRYDHNSDGTIKWVIKDSIETGIFLAGTAGSFPGGNYQEFIVSDFRTLDSFYTKQYMDRFEHLLETTLNQKFSVDTLSESEMNEAEKKLNKKDRAK